jgi:hypothetical protein
MLRIIVMGKNYTQRTTDANQWPNDSNRLLLIIIMSQIRIFNVVFFNEIINWLNDWLIDWLIDSLIHSLIDISIKIIWLYCHHLNNRPRFILDISSHQFVRFHFSWVHFIKYSSDLISAYLISSHWISLNLFESTFISSRLVSSHPIQSNLIQSNRIESNRIESNRI